MSEENKAETRRFIEEGLNQGNLDVLDELVPPEWATTIQPLPRRSAALREPSDNGVKSPSRSWVTPKPRK